MKLSTIYRIENKDGIGPYKESMGFEDDHPVYKMALDHNRLPTSSGDKGIERVAKGFEYFGFKSMKQLEKWFSKNEIEMLKTYGFHIVEMYGHVTAVGEYQVLFERVSSLFEEKL